MYITYAYEYNSYNYSGSMSAGVGHTHLSKIVAELNMPPLHWPLYKKHEKEVGRILEQMAHDSCLRAALEEKKLTVDNIDTVKSYL